MMRDEMRDAGCGSGSGGCQPARYLPELSPERCRAPCNSAQAGLGKKAAVGSGLNSTISTYGLGVRRPRLARQDGAPSLVAWIPEFLGYRCPLQRRGHLQLGVGPAVPPYDFRRQWTGTWCWLAREPSGSGSWSGGLEPSGESFPAAVAQKGPSHCSSPPPTVPSEVTSWRPCSSITGAHRTKAGVVTAPAPPPRLLLWPGCWSVGLLVGGSVGNWSSDTAGPSAAYLTLSESARDEFPGASPAWLSPDAPGNVSRSVSVF